MQAVLFGSMLGLNHPQRIRFAKATQEKPPVKKHHAPTPLEVVGHRGDYYVKGSNTVESVQSAFKAGADAAEVDVQLTKDHTPILYHDELLGDDGLTFPGDTPHKAINDCTLAELKSARFNPAALDAQYSKRAGKPLRLRVEHHEIPALDELLPLPKDKRLYIELKRQSVFKPYEDELEATVVDWVRRNNLQAQVVLISFNPFTLAKVKALAPEVKTGLDVGELTHGLVLKRDIEDFKTWLNIDYWLPPFEHVTEAMVKTCHQAGLKIVPWIWHGNMRQEQAQIRKLTTLGVDGVITNQPGYANKWRPKSDRANP